MFSSGRFRRSLLLVLNSILVGCLWSTYVRALDPHHALAEFGRQTWLTENGLPQNTVQAITQTADGYVWLATEAGLARFDGISFKIFDKQSTPELRSNDIRGLAKDTTGALWVGTPSGLVRFAAGEWRAFTTADGLPSDIIQSLYADSQDNIWVATPRGLARYREGRFVVYNEIANVVFADREGTVWIGKASGPARFQNEKFTDLTLPDTLTNRNVSAIAEDKRRRIWFGTPDGLGCFDQGAWRAFTTRDGLPNNRVTGLMADDSGSVWVGTGAGLARVVDDRLAAFPAGDPLANDTILTVYEDREGSVWVGAEAAGVTQLKDKKFTAYTQRDGLAGDVVKAVYEDGQGNIWMGTNGGGLSRLGQSGFQTYSTKEGLSSNVVLALSGDDEGTLWIGTPDGLNRFKDGKFTVYTSAEGLANDFVRSIFVDHERSVWVGTRGGLTRIKNGVFTIFTRANGLPDDFVGTILEDRRRNLWVGTLHGLGRFENEHFTSYTTKDGLSSDVVISLCEDRDGVLWIGTNGAGLNRFAGGKFTIYTTANGLTDDVVYRILEDGGDNLWLSGSRGIARVKKSELNDFAGGKIKVINPTSYGTADGMPTRECSGGGHPAGWRGRDGRLWFATIKGVVMIDPAQIRTNAQPPGVVIESVSVDDQQILTRGSVTLPPGKTRFDFYYAGLSFIAPEKVRFRYKLEGFDPDWVDGGSRRVAYYTNLPAGNYRFRVMAANNDGVWNESGAEFSFYLRPHFYRTYWFYSLAALALGLVIWQLYRYRVRQMEAQFGAVLAERARIAREIHDNLAQEILGISVQLELVARMLSVSPASAKTYLDRARVLVRNSVAEARRYVWDLRSPALEANDLPAALNEAARRLTADTPVQAQVNVSGVFRRLPAAIEANLLRIGQEAISNVVKHALAQKILINLKFEAHQIQMSVRDDGRGFEAAAEKRDGHFGLIGMRERAAQIGGRLSINSQSGLGTEVVIDVPINES